MSRNTTEPSSQTENFCLDGSALPPTPDFQLEADSSVEAVIPAPEQAELQLDLENPEHPPTDSQLEFDGMEKPLFSLEIETSQQQIEQLHFRNAHNLLESLEAQDLQVPYQCRDGYCGACRCKKLAGEVSYIKEPMAWLNEGEILPCVSIPKSDLKLKLKG